MMRVFDNGFDLVRWAFEESSKSVCAISRYSAELPGGREESTPQMRIATAMNVLAFLSRLPAEQSMVVAGRWNAQVREAAARALAGGLIRRLPPLQACYAVFHYWRVRGYTVRGLCSVSAIGGTRQVHELLRAVAAELATHEQAAYTAVERHFAALLEREAVAC